MITVSPLSALWKKLKDFVHPGGEYENKESHGLPMSISELISLLGRRDYRDVEVENLLFLHHIKNGEDQLVVVSVGGLIFSDVLSKRLAGDYGWLKKQPPGTELVIMEKNRKPFYITGVDKITGCFKIQPVNFKKD